MPRKFITKFTTPPASNLSTQEVFSKVAEHLVAQGERALRKTNLGKQSSYRGDGGTKCAVGCLINDKDYVPEMECHGTDLHRMLEAFEPLHHLIPHIPVLLPLQRIHDLSITEDYVEEIKPKLRLLAEELSLTIPASIKDTTPKKEV